MSTPEPPGVCRRAWEQIGSIREATDAYWCRQEGVGVQGSTPEPPGVCRRAWEHVGSIREATGAYWSKQEGIGVQESIPGTSLSVQEGT